MSSHSYRTTTVEYYEYLVPDAYNYESIPWPIHAAIPATHMTSPLGYVCYLSQLQDHLAMSGGNNQHSEIIIEIAPFQPRQTIIEYREQQSEQEPEQQQRQHCSNPEHDQDQVMANMNEEFETEDVEAASSEPKRKKKNIYQAKQGYIVEEPTSDSEEGPEGTS